MDAQDRDGAVRPQPAPTSAATRRSWRTDVALRHLAPADYDLVTVDVFDTLLFRTCGDVGALHALAEASGRDRGIVTPALPAGAFAALRGRIEREARDAANARSGHREVTLEDIYARWPAEFGDPGALVALELATERRVLVANPYVVNFLRACCDAGRRAWLLSDCYIPGVLLTSLLDGCGVGCDLYERLVVSCDHDASKEDGRLFEMVAAEAGLDRRDHWLHVGDNALADVSVPARQGLRTVHYRTPHRLERVERREALLGQHSGGPLRLWRRLAARREAPDGDAGIGFDLGRHVIGPPLHAFCGSVVRYCAEYGLRRVAPFQREGALLSRLIEHEARRLGCALDTRPLHVSREALLLPSLAGAPDRDFLVGMARTNTGRTMRDVLRLVRCDIAPPAGLEPWLDRPLIGLLGDPGPAFDRFAAFLQSGEVADGILHRAAEARAAAVAYLHGELGGGEGGDVVTVDLGARGSTQAMLGRLPGIGDRYRFHHHLFYAVDQLFERLTDGHRWLPFAGLHRGALDRAAVIYRSPQIIELALVGGLPTTTGYGWRDGVAKPLTSPPAGGAEQLRWVEACQSGILHASEVISDLVGGSAVAAGAGVSPDAALDVLFRLVQAPLPEEVEQAAGLRYDLNDGLRSEPCLSDAAAAAAIRRLDTVHPASIPTLAMQIPPARLLWPQATMTLIDENAMVRAYETVTPGLRHDTYVRLLLEHMRSQGVDRAILCAAGGDGGMGPAFFDMAPVAGIAVEGYFDLFADRIATPLFHGAPVLDEDLLATQRCADFAILSLGYAERIADIVGRRLQAAGRSHRILMLPMHQ
ncbi:hypothetical protein [Azospirillum melinis]